MYRPEHFRVEDVARMHALIRARPFASLVSNGSTGLCASHLPTVLKDEGSYGVIECHLARTNPHWKDVASGNEALMIFQGPEGYITPNWYPSKAQHGKVVPTWNYAIVHAYGHPEVMENKDWLRRHVGELTMQQEQTQVRSQNRELNDQLGVTKGLGQRAEGDDLEIADLIQRNLKTKN